MYRKHLFRQVHARSCCRSLVSNRTAFRPICAPAALSISSSIISVNRELNVFSFRSKYIYERRSFFSTFQKKVSSSRSIKGPCSPWEAPVSFVLPERVATAVTFAMANSTADQANKVSSVLGESVTVIRYQPGDERFQMQITLKNGKEFNFDRKCSETVSTVLSRIVANVGKKIKNFNGTVKFLSPNGSSLVSSDAEAENIEFDRILRAYFESSTVPALQVHVGEDIYDVVFNPPEVYAVKFFGMFMPTFPLFPYRMETSENFCKEKSTFKWELSREKPSPKVPPKLRKKSKDESNESSRPSEWEECGTEFVFIPEKGMEGCYLRFTCTPSNGLTLGRPFSKTLPNPIAPLPVEQFLYEERLSRLQPSKLEGGDCLRVLSYNVLADTYATPEWFISSPKESLEAGYRLPMLDREIQLYQADLICMQEVDDKFFEGNFEPFLRSQGYKGIHTSKIGNTKEGIATFHNPAKLKSIESFECVILEHMKKLPFLWTRLQAVGKEFIERLEERNTVFQVSAFQVVDCPQKTILLVANVHLYFHPDADHIRLIQTITCLNFLQSKVSLMEEICPDQRIAVIFCGDFNCTPPFSSYRLLTSGQVEPNDEDWTSHPEEKISPGILFNHSLNLTNSHPAQELTNITTCFEGCLDYILYQSDSFQLLRTFSPPSKEELAVLTKTDDVSKVSLPNFYTPSDHLPLIADLKFKF